MSRIAKIPVSIPDDVEVTLNGQEIIIKGKNGTLNRTVSKAVKIKYFNNQLIFIPRKEFYNSRAQAGTARSLLNSMVIGVTKGFIKKLLLIGVGYRATIKDDVINLSLGFSHIINYKLPKGIIAKCPSQTEIVLEGLDKQVIGQVAAELRSYRVPEPYKGKGIRYEDEVVRNKESKKK
ncbi:50S ribosomal protein L6 [Arsenophonus endosymbiont of Lipoptena cervi]|uniref:50S ribosomal protein L6 n=1 Tax=Arsenophonus endosymbiont of Lipoptena cervi TaxID=363258 RepID=UPI00376EEB99